MAENFLEKLFEHNNWANLQLIQTCSTLSDEQLDAEPHSATKGNIRDTLFHLVVSQQGYLRMLTVPLEQRLERLPTPPFAELKKSAGDSGEGLIALARSVSGFTQAQLQTRDGYLVEPWVLLLQIINHATEHREQIKSMLTALGITPPEIDGWNYGEFENALTLISK